MPFKAVHVTFWFRFLSVDKGSYSSFHPGMGAGLNDESVLEVPTVLVAGPNQSALGGGRRGARSRARTRMDFGQFLV